MIADGSKRGRDAPLNHQQRDYMFKIIGATVVYGFALYGLGRWLADQPSFGVDD
ncbi:hypothetical protein D3C73_1218070 [compost metagenome]